MIKGKHYMEYIDQEFKNIAKLLKQLKKYANHLRDVEWEGSYASGIEFAVKVIENNKFPYWVKEGEWND